MRARLETPAPVGKQEARSLWRSARTFEELCALGARFVSGTLPVFPGWGAAALDLESDPLASDLAALNRAGFLTVASQPGRAAAADRDGVLVAQRAFACGFANGKTAAGLGRAANASGLCATVFPPGGGGGRREPVSLRAGEPRVFAGHCAIEEELSCFEDFLGSAGLTALSRAWWVSVHDPVWGRGPDLWDALRRALRPAGE